MRIVADTSVWSLFLRRKKEQESKEVDLLRQAIVERRVQMLGIIRQELLSGIKGKRQFASISEILDGFPDLLAATADHTLAAEFFNKCRSKGVQGSPIDFLICAQAYRNGLSILSTDKDYSNYSNHLPIELSIL